MWINLEIFLVASRPNKRYIHVSRTKYSRTTLFLLKHLRITIFPPIIGKFWYFLNIFKCIRRITLKRLSSNYLFQSSYILVFIYLIFISEINCMDGQLFKNFDKILLETRLWETIRRFFLWLLGQINVIFVFPAWNRVDLFYCYRNI